MKYTDSSIFDMDRQKTLYRRYLLSNIRYWTLSEKYKDKCRWNVSTVVFFFDDECDECPAMATRLDYLKKKYGEDLLVFPINLELAEDDPVAQTLVSLYNATSLPVAVIDGEIYGGLSLESLEGLICRRINC